MMRWLKAFCLIWLCLSLGAGSVSMAIARGQSAALAGSGTIVICSGNGFAAVALDAQGKPVGPVHLCPDCLAGLAAYIAPALAHFPVPDTRFSSLLPPARPSLVARCKPPVPSARGPPVQI